MSAQSPCPPQSVGMKKSSGTDGRGTSAGAAAGGCTVDTATSYLHAISCWGIAINSRQEINGRPFGTCIMWCWCHCAVFGQKMRTSLAGGGFMVGDKARSTLACRWCHNHPTLEAHGSQRRRQIDICSRPPSKHAHRGPSTCQAGSSCVATCCYPPRTCKHHSGAGNKFCRLVALRMPRQ